LLGPAVVRRAQGFRLGGKIEVAGSKRSTVGGVAFAVSDQLAHLPA
jgi:hypothetical protein